MSDALSVRLAEDAASEHPSVSMLSDTTRVTLRPVQVPAAAASSSLQRGEGSPSKKKLTGLLKKLRQCKTAAADQKGKLVGVTSSCSEIATVVSNPWEVALSAMGGAAMMAVETLCAMEEDMPRGRRATEEALRTLSTDSLSCASIPAVTAPTVSVPACALTLHKLVQQMIMSLQDAQTRSIEVQGIYLADACQGKREIMSSCIQQWTSLLMTATQEMQAARTASSGAGAGAGESASPSFEQRIAARIQTLSQQLEDMKQAWKLLKEGGQTTQMQPGGQMQPAPAPGGQTPAPAPAPVPAALSMAATALMEQTQGFLFEMDGFVAAAARTMLPESTQSAELDAISAEIKSIRDHMLGLHMQTLTAAVQGAPPRTTNTMLALAEADGLWAEGKIRDLYAKRGAVLNKALTSTDSSAILRIPAQEQLNIIRAAQAAMEDVQALQQECTNVQTSIKLLELTKEGQVNTRCGLIKRKAQDAASSIEEQGMEKLRSLETSLLIKRAEKLQSIRDSVQGTAQELRLMRDGTADGTASEIGKCLEQCQLKADEAMKQVEDYATCKEQLDIARTVQTFASTIKSLLGLL